MKKKRRKRRFIAPQFQPSELPSVESQKPLAEVTKSCQDAPAVWLALCQLALNSGSLTVYPTLARLAELSGRKTVRLRNISNALHVLHRAGYLVLRRTIIERSTNPSGKPVTVLTVTLRADGHPVMPYPLFQARIDPRAIFFLDSQQTPVSEVASADWRRPAVFLALCSLASAQGNLRVRANKAYLVALAGLLDRTGEATGKALKGLTKAGWIEVTRRSGRRGKSVQFGEYRIVPGRVTQAFLPILALWRESDPNPLIPILGVNPTSALEGVEQALRACTNYFTVPDPAKAPAVTASLGCKGNKEVARSTLVAAGAASTRASRHSTSTSTATAALGVRSARQSLDRLAEIAFNQLAADTLWPGDPKERPTSQVELFRPRILDHSLWFVFNIQVPIAERVEQLSLHAQLVQHVKDVALWRANGIRAMKKANSARYVHYKSSPRNWCAHLRCYEDWAQEAADILLVAGFIRKTLKDMLEAVDDFILGVAVSVAGQELRKILKRLNARRANRGNRRIYFEGADLAYTALAWLEDGKESKVELDDFFKPIGSVRPELDQEVEEVPSYMPRYVMIEGNRRCWDSLTHLWSWAPPGCFDGDMVVARTDPFDLRSAIPSMKYRKALRRIADLEFKAFRELRGDNDLFIENSDEALWILCHNTIGNLHSNIPYVNLIASTVPIDGHKPEDNLEPFAALYKTYARARKEYKEAPMLGMIVRMARKLWIIHDDAELPKTKGHSRYLCKAPDGKTIWVFESLQAFRHAAKLVYKWFEDEDM